MTKLLLIIGIFLGGVHNNTSRNFTNGDENWEYFEFNEPIKIKVIRHNVAPGECGAVSFASLTIGETMDGDTIRVLELCNTKNNLNPNEIVTVNPVNKPEFNSLLPNQHVDDLKITKTTYGKIVKK